MLVLPALAALPLAWNQDEGATAAHKKDRASVEACVTDYVQGFYTAAPERLEKALSKDLKKMGYWKGEGKGFAGLESEGIGKKQIHWPLRGMRGWGRVPRDFSSEVRKNTRPETETFGSFEEI